MLGLRLSDIYDLLTLFGDFLEGRIMFYVILSVLWELLGQNRFH